MKNKGFTLVELLGVIVILSLIMVFALPKVIGSIKSSTKDTDKLTTDLILKASSLYVENSNYFLKINGNRYKITIRELVDSGLLKSPVKLSDEDVTYSKCVEATYNNGYTFEIKDSCTEKKNPCKLISGEAKAFGSKYACYVNDDTLYNFYVFSSNEDGTTNLIMERNICADGSLATASNPCLTNEVWEYVRTATSSWVNTKYDYHFDQTTDVLGKDGFLEWHFTSENARVLSETELQNASINSNNQFFYEYLAPESEWGIYSFFTGSAGSWDVSTQGPKPTNNIEGIPCYWLIENAYAMNSEQLLVRADGKKGIADNSGDESCSNRPVITVNLDK